MYDIMWGGIISRDGLWDVGVDFGFGVYNDYYYYFGYFVYVGMLMVF